MEQDTGKRKTKIWAHRGAVEYAPENTLEAFEAAVRLGADGIELDIHETRDKEIVVIHDEKIDRTSNGRGWVKDFSLEELRKFDFSRGTEFGKQYTIPTMREVFELIRPTDLTINIELKTNIIHYPGIENHILKMAEEFGMSDRVWYSSFNHFTIEKIHLLDPDAKVGFLYGDAFTGMPVYARKAGVNALHPAFFNLFSPRFMDDCRNNGIDVNIWTIDSEEQMLACLEAGVHAIITNYPDKAIKTAKDWYEGGRAAEPLSLGTLLGKESASDGEDLFRRAAAVVNPDQRQRREKEALNYGEILKSLKAAIGFRDQKSLTGNDEIPEKGRPSLFANDEQTRQKLFELFRSKYMALEPEEQTTTLPEDEKGSGN